MARKRSRYPVIFLGEFEEDAKDVRDLKLFTLHWCVNQGFPEETCRLMCDIVSKTLYAPTDSQAKDFTDLLSRIADLCQERRSKNKRKREMKKNGVSP